MVRTTVNQAYWYYIALDCSPKFYSVIVTRSENALTLNTDGIKVGWDDLDSDISTMSTKVSHEMFHVMCQLAIQEDPETGEDMLWLREGNANYVVGMERIEHSGMLSGVKQTFPDHNMGMAEWVSESFCEISPKRLEQGDERKVSPYFGAIDEVAASLLVQISPNGINSFLHYYELRQKVSNEEAFEIAFGITKDSFYQQYQQECANGFPSIAKYNKTPTTTKKPTPTFTTENPIISTGTVILKDNTQKFSDFVITFCNINEGTCLPGIPIKSNGTFSTSLLPGKYRVSINSPTNGQIIGWYTNNGIVPEPTCARTITVDVKHEIDITINLQKVSC